MNFNFFKYQQAFRWVMWVIVAIFYGLDYLQHTIPSVLILPISNSLKTDYVSVTNAMNIYFPVYALSQIPAGYLIDRYGLRNTLCVASLVLSAGLCMMLFPRIHDIFIGRILIAVGSAFAWNGGLKAASTYLPRSIFPLMTGILNSIGVLGGVTGILLLDHLIGLAGWRHAVSNLALFGAAWAVVMFLFLRPRNPNQKGQLKQLAADFNAFRILKPLKDKKLWMIATYAALITAAVMSTFAESYSVIALEKIKFFSAHRAALLNSILFIGVGVGGPLHGVIAQRTGSKTRWLLICAALTGFIYVFVIYLFSTQAHFFLFASAYFFLGFFVSSMLLTYAIAKEIFPLKQQALVFSFINMIVMLTGYIIPLLFGMLVHVPNFTILPHTLFLPITALLLPIIGACMIAIRINKRHYF